MVSSRISRVALGARRNRLISYNAWPHLEGVDDAHLLTHR